MSIKKKWLITGGCGFIGLQLITELLKRGNCQVCIVDNLTVGSRDDLRSVSEFVEVEAANSDQAFDECSATQPCALVVGDILDQSLALSLAGQADVIVHLAANTGVGPSVQNPREDCNTNILGTLNYLEGARASEHCRFVFASSGAPLGEVETPPIHENLPANPVSPYGASKLAGEGYCSAYFSSFGIDTVALRFGNVYGPGSLHKDSVVAKFIKLAMDDKPLELYGDGTQTRDFIYIADLVQAILAAAEKPDVGGEKFQIATNRESTVLEVAQMLMEVLPEHGIAGGKLTYGEARTGDVLRNFSDISKAKQHLGWEPAFELREGLAQTVKYFKTLREQ